jgi:hypothetical protein
MRRTRPLLLATAMTAFVGFSSVGSAAYASTYGIEYYIAAPFVQGSYLTTGVLSEDFDDLPDGDCRGSIGVGIVSGARCNVEPAGDYGGATVEATDATPTVGGGGVGKYASTDSSAMTITFADDQRYLGLWWSAGSSGNTLTFYDGDTEVLELGTSELRTVLGTEPADGGSDWETTGTLESEGGDLYPKHHFFGNPRGYTSTDPAGPSSLVRWEPFVYIHIFTSGGLTFDSVVLSGSDGFEFDNVVVSTQTQTPDESLVRIGSISSPLDPPEQDNVPEEEERNQDTVAATSDVPTLARTGGPNLLLLAFTGLAFVVAGGMTLVRSRSSR